MEISIKDLKTAYCKLKSHVYYDTSDLFIRRQLATFESNKSDSQIFFLNSQYKTFPIFDLENNLDLEKKFYKIAESINNYHENSDFFDSFLKEIKIQYLPKKFQLDQLPKNFISNQRIKEKYNIERLTAFIDIPIELHLITVLWILLHGKNLDAKLNSCCYGNRLHLNKNNHEIIYGSSLFHPYFSQYQKWRDNAVAEAQSQLENNNDVFFINLDIKDYYYSVRIDFETLNIELFKNEAIDQATKNLINIFTQIHEIFTQKLIKTKIPCDYNSIIEQNESILPIGLLSSFILGNWYLNKFDSNILSNVKPVYYGRYVDDILLVIKNPSSIKNKKYKSADDIIKDELKSVLKVIKTPAYLKNKSKAKNNNINYFQLKGNNFKYLLCQSDKTLIYYFDHKESDLVINKLKRELEERSSEFRDFPEESNNKTFEDSAYHLLYDDSEGKIRTLKDYKENRFGLSVYLSHKIFAALRYNKKTNPKESKSLLNFFKGQTCLDFYKSWEKTLTYFLVNNDAVGFVDFYIHTFTQIKKITAKNNTNFYHIDDDDIAGSLMLYLDCSLEIVLALNPYFLTYNKPAKKKMDFFQKEMSYLYSYLVSPFSEATNEKSFHINRFRESNLIRHHYVLQSLVNYTNHALNKKHNLSDIKLPISSSANQFDFIENSLSNSPRAVKFWECCIATIFKEIDSFQLEKSNLNNLNYSSNIFGYKTNKNPESDNFYLFDSIALYKKINKNHIPEHILESSDFIKDIINIFRTTEDSDLVEIHVNTKESLTNPKISFANTQVIESNMISSLRNSPFLDVSRYNTLQKIFKQTREEDADVLLLPENFLPYEFLSSLAQFSANNDILSVSGLEHFTFKKLAHNFIVTILPCKINNRNDAVVSIRLKNHYAPGEAEWINGENLIVPKPKCYRYDLFNWKNIYFSPLYCFELADSNHRSKFKSLVDLLIVSEWNKDIPYYSNIVESLSRDIHAYIAQVNTSQHGDSRLTRPSKTDTKDILKLKGGLNDTILTGQIDINLLREFQRKLYSATKNDKSFKPLPPDYNAENVIKRIKNKPIFDNHVEIT